MPDQQIQVQFSANPHQVTMAGRDGLKLTLAATNTGAALIDPQFERAELLVNGRPAKAWSLAVGNGKRLPTWSALPPGESVTMTWSTLGAALFPSPGRYTLVLTYGGSELPAVTVEVVP